ncbi:hypothetical protein LWI28_025649 [Acer negundo]|uniref:Uncharacterized protein n=1 Tax=Acer negundo TaxID=4023 RepID=A0AAD5JY04_ACENE|nr:hypothetical protein LWI28_025649 [Acer negundo]
MKLYMGECSNRRPEVRKVVSGPRVRPKGLPSKDQRKRSNRVLTVSENSSGDVSNTGPIDLVFQSEKRSGKENKATQNDRVSPSIQVVNPADMNDNEEADQRKTNFRQDPADNIKSTVAKKSRGMLFDYSVNSQLRKSRGLKCRTDLGHKSKFRKVIWNLEEEISKVIENGVAKRLEKEWRLRGRADGNGRWIMDGGVEGVSRKASWNTEEEVTKVVEIGAELGFDYNGQEDEVVEFVTMRENEDEERADV